MEHKRTLRAILFACKQRQERRGDCGISLRAAAVFRSLLTTVCALVKMALCRTWIICASKSISDHMRPQISPRRRPVWRAIRQKRYALVPNTAFRSCLDCSTVRAAFSFVAMPPERRRSGTGDFAIRFPMATGFPLTAAVSTLNGLTPCGQSVKDTIPASNPQVRNGCGCVTAPARRTSIRWPTSPL